MTELLKKLEKKGFVTCRTSEKDHRCKVVSAAERAHELHHAIGVFDDRVFTALCRGLSEGEIAEFLRITDVMLEKRKKYERRAGSLSRAGEDVMPNDPTAHKMYPRIQSPDGLDARAHFSRGRHRRHYSL